MMHPARRRYVLRCRVVAQAQTQGAVGLLGGRAYRLRGARRHFWGIDMAAHAGRDGHLVG